MSGDGARQQAERDFSAHQEQTRKLVRAMMALTGSTASGLARAAGLTPSTVNRFMHRPVRHTLSQRTMLALMTQTLVSLKREPPSHMDAAALHDLVPAVALYEKGILEKAPDVQATLARLKAAGADKACETAAPGDLPVVLATTRNVDIQNRNTQRAPLRTQRPPFLEADPKAFALLMPDNTMSPRYDAGDLLYVSPAADVAGGKGDVVVELADGGFTIGSLTMASREGVRITTLTPRARQTITHDKMRGAYRVVGVQRMGS